MNCARCQQDDPTHARFCLACGAHLAIACGSCGAELPGGARQRRGLRGWHGEVATWAGASRAPSPTLALQEEGGGSSALARLTGRRVTGQ